MEILITNEYNQVITNVYKIGLLTPVVSVRIYKSKINPTLPLLHL